MAICVDTSWEMHFPFVDSSVDNVRLQTSTSHFEFIDVPKQHHINSLLHNTTNIAKWTDQGC